MKSFKPSAIAACLLAAVSSLAGAATQDGKMPAHDEHNHVGHGEKNR
jgi:hypothetical protein